MGWMATGQAETMISELSDIYAAESILESQKVQFFALDKPLSYRGC
jgi:hypothetical protein